MDIKDLEKNCNGRSVGIVVGGLGALIVTGFVFPLGAVALPIAGVSSLIGGTIGGKLDKHN